MLDKIYFSILANIFWKHNFTHAWFIHVTHYFESHSNIFELFQMWYTQHNWGFIMFVTLSFLFISFSKFHLIPFFAEIVEIDLPPTLLAQCTISKYFPLFMLGVHLNRWGHYTGFGCIEFHCCGNIVKEWCRNRIDEKLLWHGTHFFECKTVRAWIRKIFMKHRPQYMEKMLCTVKWNS